MSTRLLCVLAMAVLATGCISPVSIQVDDSTRFTQIAGSFPINEESSTRLRFRWSEVSGEDDQRLDTGELIRLGNTDILGPTVIDIDLDLVYYSAAIGSEIESQDGLTLISYLGISQTDFDFTLSESGNRLEHGDKTTELYMQIGFSAEIAESLDLGFSGAFSIGRDVSGISELDLSLAYELMPSLVLSGGYRWFKYEYASGNLDSNLEVDFTGPFIGIYLPF